jgi:SMC interacting uncharacterized protein involved in chromosome segregation
MSDDLLARTLEISKMQSRIRDLEARLAVANRESDEAKEKTEKWIRVSQDVIAERDEARTALTRVLNREQAKWEALREWIEARKKIAADAPCEWCVDEYESVLERIDLCRGSVEQAREAEKEK